MADKVPIRPIIGLTDNRSTTTVHTHINMIIILWYKFQIGFSLRFSAVSELKL